MSELTARITRNGPSDDDWQLSSLAVIYLTLAAYFLFVRPQPAWFGITAFTGLLSGAAWLVNVRGPEALRLRGRLGGAAASRLAGLAPIYFALPIPIMAAWFAGEIALQQDPQPNYWQAFSLWLISIGVFIGFLLPWRRLATPVDVGKVVAAIPWREVGIVTFLTLVAFGARAVDLVHEPNPFSGDEANFGLQAIEVLDGFRKNMFATGVPFGQPSLYYFLVAPFLKVFGVGILGTRLPSVLFGVSMIPLFYLLLRELFEDRRIALIGAAFLAVYHFHIHFSRVGLNNMSAGWIAVLTLYFAARAARTQKPLDFGLAGAAAGLSMYSFVAARAVPVVLGLYFGWVVLFNWRFLRANFGNFLVLVAGFAIVAAPQGLYFLKVPDDFYSGHRWANVFSNGWLGDAERARHEGAFTIMVGQFRDAFAVLVRQNEVYHHYNPGQPLIDAFSRWFFVIGGVISVVRIRQGRYFMFLALLILTVIMGAAVVFPPPSAARMVPMAPAIAAMVAIGLVGVADTATRFVPRIRPFVPALLVAAVLGFTYINIQFYFGDYLPHDRYVPGDNDVTFAIGRYLHGEGPDHVNYLFGLPRIYTGDPTIQFIGGKRLLVEVKPNAAKVPEVKTTLKDATLLFVPERENESLPIRKACPAGVWTSIWEPLDKRVLFSAYELPGGIACLQAAELIAPEPKPPSRAAVSQVPTVQDEQRRKDLNLIHLALEQYRNDQGSYPSSGGLFQTLCVYKEIDAGCKLSKYLNPIPADPAGNAIENGYFYVSDGRAFSLFSVFEGPADPIGADCLFYSAKIVGNAPVRVCVSGRR